MNTEPVDALTVQGGGGGGERHPDYLWRDPEELEEARARSL